MNNDLIELKISEYGISPLPENPVVAMAYVPYQNPNSIYTAEKGINYGTMFPCLNKPFLCTGEEQKWVKEKN